MFRALSLIWLIWGMNWVVMKTANLYFPPVLFVTYRFASGALVLLIAAILMKVPMPQAKFLPYLLFTGVFQISLNNVLVQTGMVTLGAGTSAVLNYTMPLWVAIMAHFMLGENLTRQKLGGIFLSLIGLYILMGLTELTDVRAAFLTLLSAMSWALASVITKMKLKGCSMMQIVTWQMISGAIVLVIYSAFVPQGDVDWNLNSALILIYNGVLASALAFFIWNWLLMKIEASKASTAVLGVPVVGVLGGIIILGEPLTFHVMLGMVMILAGICVVVNSK